MSLLLAAVWSLAKELHTDPAVILGWRESQVALWTVVSDRHGRRELLRYMSLLSCAVWDPKTVAKMLRDPAPPATQEDVERALATAGRVAGERRKQVSIEDAVKLAKARGAR